MNETYLIIHCVYFKASGKYYAQAADKFNKQVFTESGERCIYPRDYGRVLRTLKMLPGLVNGTWEGPFIINVGSYIELVLPEEKQT